jgi:hypothetical protein
MINLTARYYDRVIELTKKYPELLCGITPETIGDDDLMADILSSIKIEDMESNDYRTLCVYSRLLDIIAGDPFVDGVFILYEQDKADLKNLINDKK